jgi:kynurenine formamidase/predicted N-acetyltransferase YhbS
MLIDLSHPLLDGQPTFPSDPPLRLRRHGDIASLGYNITAVQLSTHQGTHLDVPYHFFDDGPTVDRMPLEQFFGPATLVDLAPGRALDPHTAITQDMLLPHQAAFQPGRRVIYRTGWERKFGRPEYFEGYPSLTVAAARWIAQRRIALLGMDTPSPGEDWTECHRILLGPDARMIIVENLANLDRLPERFTFMGFPLPLPGCDGSPIRAVALVEPDTRLLSFRVLEEGSIEPALDAAIRRLLCECFPPDIGVFSVSRAWNGVWPAFSAIAWHGDEVVGQLGIVDRQITCAGRPVRVAGIQNLAVSASWRGTGLAQRLMVAAMDEARRRGFRHGLLFCVPKLADFYGRQGWRRIDRPVTMHDAAGRSVPLTAKNICMEFLLAEEGLPAGAIDLEGRDW